MIKQIFLSTTLMTLLGLSTLSMAGTTFSFDVYNKANTTLKWVNVKYLLGYATQNITFNNNTNQNPEFETEVKNGDIVINVINVTAAQTAGTPSVSDELDVMIRVPVDATHDDVCYSVTLNTDHMRSSHLVQNNEDAQNLITILPQENEAGYMIEIKDMDGNKVEHTLDKTPCS